MTPESANESSETRTQFQSFREKLDHIAGVVTANFERVFALEEIDNISVKDALKPDAHGLVKKQVILKALFETVYRNTPQEIITTLRKDPFENAPLRKDTTPVYRKGGYNNSVYRATYQDQAHALDKDLAILRDRNIMHTQEEAMQRATKLQGE